MTTFTAEELSTRVLKDLGVIASDETPSASDLNDATEIIASEILAMGMRGLPIWAGSTSVIPQEYLSALSRRLGLAVGPTFGMSNEKAIVSIDVAERYIRQLSSPPVLGAPTQADYF